MFPDLLSELTNSFYIKLFLEASFLVQAVMVLLLFLSLYSWALILGKQHILSKANRAARKFENQFWKNKDFNGLYNRISGYRRDPKGLESIFFTGYVEFAKQRKQNIAPEVMLNSLQRVMKVALVREVDRLDKGLSTLATIGSVSPYIGLFGTVWGIMHSFHALGNVQQATLAMVAPGISEALVATAIGLFVAIPAVIAYNSYMAEIDRLTSRYDNFLEEFTNLLQRQIYAKASS